MIGTPQEADAADAVLSESVARGDWDGLYAITEADEVCRFGASIQDMAPCGAPIQAVVVLRGHQTAHAIVMCQHHANVMKDAIERRRRRS